MYLNTPSQFLGEIPEELMAEMKLLEGRNYDNLNDSDVQYLPDV